MTETVTFWAELWWPMEKNSHGEALISPRFETERDCVMWVRDKRVPRGGNDPQVGMWRRVSRGTDFDDQPLSTEDAPLPDPARLHGLISELKAMLEAKERDLKRQPKVQR